MMLALCLATVGCAVVIASFSLDQGAAAPGNALRAERLLFVNDIVAVADKAREALDRYESSSLPADRDTFLATCDGVAAKVGRLRQVEHLSEEQSGQVIDLCVSIRQQLSKLGSSPADRMIEAGALLDRIRRVVLGIGLDEVRVQDARLAEQSAAAIANRRMTAGLAVIEVLLVAGLIFLIVRLGRLEQFATVCAWTHRIRHEGQWMSLEHYLEKRFGVRASDGVTPEQAARIMADEAINGRELLRLIEFEKAATDLAEETHRAIHAVRNHLTAVLCYSEMAGHGDQEAQRDMATRVLSHANTISAEVDHLHTAVRTFHPQPPNLHVLRHPGQEKRSVA